MRQYIAMVVSTILILFLIFISGFEFDRAWKIQVVGILLILWNWFMHFVFKKDRRNLLRRIIG